MDLQPGDAFDRYTIEGLLGQGGMGRVYRARDGKLQRLVALKLLRLDASDSHEHASAHLLREARAAAAIEHVNAIAIYDVGEVDGVPYIAMELVEGSSLRARIGDPDVTAETRVQWLVAIAGALAAAHARGLIHRDIKPENVMLRRDGVIKVLDFGIARTEPQLRDEVEVTLPGTPRYMAPEQMKGEPLDARIDQFAWGVLGYELLTGHPPWSGEAVSLSFVLSVLHEPAAPEPLFAVCRGSVARAVLRALSKDREERFPSMKDAAAALAPHRSSSRWTAAMLAVVAVGLGAALLVSSSRARSASLATAIASAGLAPALAPTRLTDLPTPSSDIAEAKAAYIAGVHAIHDGSIVPGVKELVRATLLDPSLAAAHLRLITHGRGLSESDDRPHFAKARELHALLTPRDQALLVALEPSFLAIPPDEKEVTRRLEDLATRFPLDAEIQYLAATRERDATRVAARLEGAIALDPEFALALWRKANAHLGASDFPSTLASLDRCIAVAPSSTACLTVRALVYEELGRCAEMDRDARVVELVSPSPRTHDLVARVLLANGAPIAAVRDALARKWAAASESDRATYRMDDETHLAILSGDFATAERLEREAAAGVESSAREDDHESTIVPLVALYVEMGKATEATRLADQYLKARASWQSIGAWAPVPQMMAVAVHGGARTEAERKRALAAWLPQWDAVDAQFRTQSWVAGYAVPAATEAEGVAAMAVAPQPLPRPHLNQFHREWLGVVGNTVLLAGRFGEAVPLLRAAAATCSALPAPLEHTQAHLHFAQALEKTQDVAGACAEYQIVLDRWGAAKPKSVSADLARARRSALGCAR